MNRPGLSELRWRVGTHASILARLQALLPTQAIPDGEHAGDRPLANLSTRASDDPSIAILDAFAILGDILAFYQERILNEGYLRTATERRSVLELARAIGYELSPGVSASAYLAFTISDPSGVPGLAATVPGLPTTPTTVTVPQGTKVQSVPGQDELPQMFETAEEIEARAAWNEMRPLLTRRLPFTITAGGQVAVVDLDGAEHPVDRLWLSGTSTNLKSGDRLRVSIDGVGAAVLTVDVVEAIPDQSDPTNPGVTRVDVSQGGAEEEPPPLAWDQDLEAGTVTDDEYEQTPDNVSTLILARRWSEEDLAAFIAIQEWDEDELLEQVAELKSAAAAAAEIHVFRQKLGVFGSSSPPAKTGLVNAEWTWPTWDDPDQAPDVWSDSSLAQYTDADLFLERAVEKVVAGGLALLEAPGLTPAVFDIDGVVEGSLADFAIAGKATGLVLTDVDKTAHPFPMRKTTVWVQSEALALAGEPVDDTVSDGAGAGASEIMLDALVLGLAVGQIVTVGGDTADSSGAATGTTASELAELASITHVGGTTVLGFVTPLTNIYVRSTMTINANTVKATHGETVTEEVLGSGDASIANQSFTLQKAPLTHISSATASGTASTLEVRVNGVEWTEQPSLYGLAATDQAYTLRRSDEGDTTVVFGDGVSGARLPTGRENVVATYRAGIGADGEVGAEKISLLATRPLGVQSVLNPTAASGAEDPEDLDDARGNAPLTVLTLDRVVSLRDYQDFARAFAGIGKATAAPIWAGTRRIAHVTVAGATGGTVDPLSDTYVNLVAGIAAASDPSQEFAVDSYAPRFFKLDATIYVDSSYVADDVLAEVKEALAAGFDFEARDLAQPVSAAEVTKVIHEVDGVVAVKFNAFHGADEEPAVRAFVEAPAATWDAAQKRVLPAVLLLIHPTGIVLAPAEEGTS